MNILSCLLTPKPGSCIFREPLEYIFLWKGCKAKKRLACVELWNIEHPIRQPTQFLCRVSTFSWVFAVLKAVFMNYPNAFDFFSCMDFSERTKCASFIEIIRVITAKYLVAVPCLL